MEVCTIEVYLNEFYPELPFISVGAKCNRWVGG
jgi:hypothetical protein